MKQFWLKRIHDISGTSGTGIVAEGTIFSNGWCTLHWLTSTSSLAFYKNIEELEEIHGHNGATKVIYSLKNEELPVVKKGLSDNARQNLVLGIFFILWVLCWIFLQ